MALHNLSPPLKSELFQLKDIKYNLRQGKKNPSSATIITSHYGTETISYLAQ